MASTRCWMTTSHQSRQDPGMLEVDYPTCYTIILVSYHIVYHKVYIYRMYAVCIYMYIYIYIYTYIYIYYYIVI